MVRRFWPVLLIILCFVFLTGYILINDFGYRIESRYIDVQIKAYQLNSYLYRYIGTLRGLLLTTNGFGQTLDEARVLKLRTEELAQELKEDAEHLNPELRDLVDSYTKSVEAGLKLGQELIDNGELLLAQPDLPEIYREGRIGLSSLTGKDIMDIMGDRSAYQYYQLVRRLKGMNVLFDELYSSKLEDLLQTVTFQSAAIRRKIFIIRIVILGATVIAVSFLIFQLYRLNRFLRKLAEKTKKELTTTQTYLTEVQDHLQNARFQHSLFEMVAGISHELNTPLGNCIAVSTYLESTIGEMSAEAEGDSISREKYIKSLDDSKKGFHLIQENLQQMRFQIETFKRLSNVNHDFQGSVIPLQQYLEQELLRSVTDHSPAVEVKLIWDRTNVNGTMVRYGDLNQIFEQFIINSIEHGQADNVSIRFRVKNGNLTIEYWDSGKELEPETIERIAEPFYTTVRGMHHMGLGLSIIVSLISNKLRGSIEFIPNNPGLRIDVSLPLKHLN